MVILNVNMDTYCAVLETNF